MLRLLAGSFLFLSACAADPCAGVSGNCVRFDTGATEKTIRSAFSAAQANTTFAFAEGTFKFTNAVAVANTNGVTIKGAGSKTILDFSGQTTGTSSLSFAKCNGVSVHDFALQNAQGAALQASTGVGFHAQNISISWSAADPAAQRLNGINATQTSDILVENNKVSGASSSGILAAASSEIVLRNNEVFGNVAGISLENSQDADVYDNNVHDNTAGILIFNAPAFTLYGGRVHAYGNTVAKNNTTNIAAKSDIVSNFPSGTGIFVVANHDVQCDHNTISGSDTASLAIASYVILGPDDYLQDAGFYPYAVNVYFHDNTVSGTGALPDLQNTFGTNVSNAKNAVFNGTVPDILYDGFADPNAPDTNAPENNLPANPMSICIGSTTSFANLHADSGNGFLNATTDPTPYQCTLPALPAVSFSGL